jgi:hypothetical protein
VNLTYWKEVLSGVAIAMIVFFILDYSPYIVYGKIPIEKKINELQWRIEELEAERHNQ